MLQNNNNNNRKSSGEASIFPIPSSLCDLEDNPYNLDPYPQNIEAFSDQNDDDAQARADAFDFLVDQLEGQNKVLEDAGYSLFDSTTSSLDDEDDGFDDEEWMTRSRMQALYTLVRKSGSLPPSTRSRLVSAICEAVSTLADILDTQASSLNNKNTSNNNDDDMNNGKDKGSSPAPLVPVTQIFRDAFACHLYMLYNVMFTFESEDKLVKLSSTVNLSSSLGATNNNNKGGNKRRKGGKKNKNGGSSSSNNNNSHSNQDFLQDQREMCANVMLKASQIIHLPRVKAKMWKCGVPDENLISLPCRISYVMLENNSFSKHACAIISSTCISHLSNNKNNNKSSAEDGANNSSNGEEQQKQTTNWNQSTTSSFMNTVSAAVLDLLHSYEHIAPLVARQLLSNHLAVDLLQEISRTDYSPSSQNNSSTQDHHHHKATGVKNVAPFISELASVKPSLVLDHIYLILPLLNSDPYMMRNSIVEAIGSILIHCCSDNNNNNNNNPINNSEENENDEYNDPSEEGETPEEEAQHQSSRKKSSNSSASTKNKTKTQNSLLDVLMERAYDKSSYTRNAVLKTWATLVKSNCIPLNRIHEVTKLAIDRLQDISVNVRKSSMQLLTLLLENNPFLGSLDPTPYERKSKELHKYLLENIPKKFLDEAREGTDAMDNPERSNDDDDDDITSAEESSEAKTDNEEGEGEKSVKDQLDERMKIVALRVAFAAADDFVDSQDEEDEELTNFYNKIAAFRFTTSALHFIEMFENSHQVFKGMLHSSNTSDVTEALRFFVKARHFDLPIAITGIKSALSLMWSNEKKVRDEVLIAFVDVFISVHNTLEEEDTTLPAKQIAHNLLVLVNESSVSELASIEEGIGYLVAEEKIPAEVFLVLWSVASKSSSSDSRAAAFLILSMGAKKNPTIVDSASRLRLLHDSGLGDYTQDHRDWGICRAACIALQQIPAKCNYSQQSKQQTLVELPSSSAKTLMLEQIVERLCIVIRGDWCRDHDNFDTNRWFSAAEQAINAIFVVCENPDTVCGEIIRDMEQITFGISSESPKSQCSIPLLSRFFFVIGHIALKLLVYTENLGKAVRQANSAKSLSLQQTANKIKNDRKSLAVAASASNSEGDESSVTSIMSGSSEDEDDDAMEDELGVAAEAEAATEQQIDEICEKEIIGRGLIGIFSPLLIRVVANEGGQFGSSNLLMQSATLALCKFMAISASFCEKHLPLLFTSLAQETSDDNTTLRTNIVVALGDLAFRFPNAVEPYTSKMYEGLRDKSDHVKRHTLMVLTHLILNDMVKVKGQVCEIALCLEDEESRIRDMSRLLFNELSKRSNNPIYNLLPDIISRLSQMDIPKESFCKIMSFFLNFIDKERQIETLVMKLCQRFPTCTSISQKADIAYCLANLSKLNDKCIKTLNDSFKLYKDALFDEDVFKHFAQILSKVQKTNVKPGEMKDIIDEWGAKLEQENKTGLENFKAGNKAARAKARAARMAAMKKTRRAANNNTTKKKKKKMNEWEGESSDESSESSDSDSSNASTDDEEESEKENEFDKENRSLSIVSPPSSSSSVKKNKHARIGSRRGPRRLRMSNQ